VESYGNADLVVVNFNTCIFYPEGSDLRQLAITARVKLPTGFQMASPLAFHGANENWQEFETTTVETLVDSPMIASRNYRRLEVDVPGFPPTRYHFVSESARALNFGDDQLRHYEQLMAEAAACFGGAPFQSYDFLVVCSDRVPKLGLEHHACSLNSIEEEATVDADKRKGSSVYLLGHELVHAWCGKYRRPAGMYTTDFHTPKATDGLWVYEGLTQYLGHILTVRAGFLTFEEHLERTAERIGYLANRSGRQWRALEDTAIAAHTLRGGSHSWNDLRRNQDYYDEGAFFWMEADAIMRKQSQGKHSLDDFCKKFFAYDPRYPKVKPFEIAEIVSILSELVPHDWSGAIQRRIRSPQPEFSLQGLRTAGYQFEFTPEKSSYLKLRETEREYISAEFSLGLTLKNDGQISSVIPDSPADQARLADHLKVIGVNDMKFTAKRLQEALEAAKLSGEIELLTEEGERFRRTTVSYRGGPKFATLKRIDGEADIYREICRSQIKAN
jgi:predicted metalloprotease with PDZ domain